MTTAYFDTVETPDGPFTVILLEGEVIAAGWTTDTDDLLSRVHPELKPTDLRHDTEIVRPVSLAIKYYYDGNHDATLTIPIHQKSGAFIERCWSELRAVPAGTTVSYSDLAASAGNPRAARAAASACANNAIALLIPCHRVLPKNGSTGGFLYGPELKDSLLKRENPLGGAGEED
ncbi:methylated-DNA--[protein]-cysteine S-methyltransferase [Corynebacterium freiburgense]|uniref:methylated-DNA--[protein]-cysteine S-methyltransferase n=1 Tax=Corynebacterium freiburgense TaxID=556548 RepID=UPI0003F5A772|nr:methylated-DNA--[protein]-cysteine S-methyltransferase [Corynebacterium freiburgense]WJZ01545.1 Bifunctional transcriptional activator/DNA repair enzyme Ada [Corynebacterium freiburgense]